MNPRNCLLILSLALAACGQEYKPPVVDAGTPPPPPPPPCADKTLGVPLDSTDPREPTVCPGDPDVACGSGWVACAALSQRAADSCGTRQGIVLGAPEVRPSSSTPTLASCPAMPTSKATIRFWRACGKFSKPVAGYLHDLQFPCGGFPRSVDCEWLSAENCAKLPESFLASTACCLRR